MEYIDELVAPILLQGIDDSKIFPQSLKYYTEKLRQMEMGEIDYNIQARDRYKSEIRKAKMGISMLRRFINETWMLELCEYKGIDCRAYRGKIIENLKDVPNAPDKKEEVKDNGMAWCYGCKKELPKTEFYKSKSKASGVQSSCKECVKEYRRKKKLEDDKIKKDKTRTGAY